MRAHAGRVVAVRAGALRMVFRIDGGGRWNAVLPQTAADAEIRFQNGGFQLSGDGALLGDLDELRKQNEPQKILAEVFGGEAAEFFAEIAARADVKNCLVNAGAAAAPDAVAEFNRQTALLAQQTRGLESRIARMEKRRV